MAKQNNRRIKSIWMFVLLLFVCVAATTVAFMNILDGFLLDDSGAISLISGEITEKTYNTGPETAGNAAKPPVTEEPTDIENSGAQDEEGSAAAPTAQPQNTQTQAKPGFEASDDNGVWSTETAVEIFHVSYENGEQVVTVKSDNGDKVIAPGTESSYTFKLSNTGNVALDYTVETEAYFTPEDVVIPVTGRLNRYDGKWIVGGKDEYVDVPVLDTAADSATLGAGKYTYYTLDWVWPFESGNDEYDTMLGNLAVGEDLVFTVVIKTTATADADPDSGGGITIPQTGDTENLALWLTLLFGSVVVMMLLMFLIFRDKEKKNTEAGTV